jgi:hypothetical protein
MSDSMSVLRQEKCNHSDLILCFLCRKFKVFRIYGSQGCRVYAMDYSQSPLDKI